MKLRTGFVSNSSSSSFVASINNLSNTDIKNISDYIDSEKNIDNWSIEIDNECNLIRGWTTMDNGAIQDFLEESNLNKVRIE